MSTTPSTQQIVQECVPAEPATIRRMRWFFLLIITLWIFSAMLLPVLVFCLTRSAISFTFYTTLAPPVYILYRIAGYLFPKDEKDFQLALTKIQSMTKKEHQKGQVST